MTEPTAQTILKRKAGAGRLAPDAAAAPAARALRSALSKAAQEVLALPLVVDALDEARLSLTELLDGLEERALLAVLEGPAEGLGLAVLSQPVLAALIEMQTMGRVGSGEVSPRRPTRTDAAMAAGFVDRVLQELELALCEEPDLVWAGGFHYASFLDDPRPLGLLLEETSYRVFRLTLDLALGAKRGTMLIALPAEGRGAKPVRKAILPDGSGDWGRVMTQTVMSTPARLDAVLHRLTLPLSAVLGLKPGDVVPMPMAAVGQVQLEGSGRQLAVGKLGQSHGHRAVRLRLEDAGEITQGALAAAWAADRSA